MRLLGMLVTLFGFYSGLLAFNVRDFGAVGDGKTDDTMAIQKALNHISSRIKLQRFQVEDNWKKGSVETFVDELVFPAGTYRISRTLYVYGSVVFRGEGKAVIQHSCRCRKTHADLYHGWTRHFPAH